MRDIRHNAKDGAQADGASRDTPVDAGSSLRNRHGRTVVVRIIWYIMGFILTLLAFRFVLSLLGANLNNGFANGIFQMTAPFVSPFSGLFRATPIDSAVYVEPNVLVAMAVYALIAWGLVKVITITR